MLYDFYDRDSWNRKKTNPLQNLFVTQQYRAHLQQHTILGERMCLLSVCNRKHDNCFFYCFLVFVRKDRCKNKIKIMSNVTKYMDAFFLNIVNI